MKKLNFLIVFGFAFSVILPAHADGGYLSLKGGVSLPKDMDVSDQFAVIQIFPTPDVPETFDFAKGVTSSIAVGRAMGRVRLEAEGFYSKIKFNIIDTSANTSADDGNVVALMANGYLDLLEGGSGTPYLGFGIGYAETKLGAQSTGEGLAFQALAGFNIHLTDNTGVGIEYRYFTSKTGGTFENYKASNIMATFSYSF